MDNGDSIFCDRAGSPQLLRGVAIYSGAPRLAELAARIGFEVIWIEMEHGPTGFELAEQLCMAVEVGGAIPAIRVPDGQRCHVLHALEVGARIVIVPMIETAEHAKAVVEHGKFPPLGKRGYNTRSRGVEYGLESPLDAFMAANHRTHLFAQVETMAAVENIDAICNVEGLSGILIGPGDLSFSAGCDGDIECDFMVEMVVKCVRRICANGKHGGILVSPGRMLDAAVSAGCDLVFYGGDVPQLGLAWPKLLSSLAPIRLPKNMAVRS